MFHRIFVFLLLFGCSSIKYPSWFLNVNRDSSKLYGIGSGVSIEEAKKVAASDIASQVRISVSSRSISTVRDDTRIGYEMGFIQDISNKVDDTIIPNYTVIKSETLEDGRFIVLVAVNKSKLIDQYKDELELINGQIENSYDSYLGVEDIFKKHLYLQHVIFLSNKARLLATILLSLDVPINTKKYNNNVLIYQDQMDKLMKRMHFNITGNDKDVNKILEKNLNGAGFSVQNGQGTDNTIQILSQTEETYNIIFDENIVTLHITVQLKNKLGDTVNSRILDVNGSSIISKEEAKRNAINNLDKKFVTDGIMNFLELSK